MKEEIWKVWKDNRSNNIKNTTGALWEVSDQGNVKKNGVLYECKLNRGYKAFGGGQTLHRVVAELFVPNPDNKPCVDHINTNKLDNRACNLRWVTYKENSNNPITRTHISEAMKGKNTGPQSEEHRKHMSEALKGKTQSEKTRINISESLKKYWKNKKEQK